VRALRDPRPTVAVAAVVVRSAVAWQSLGANPDLAVPKLDADYYLTWAREIAAGDLAGRGGLLGGHPFFLNPLYAYVIAPLVRGGGLAPLLVFQALLAGATAWLTASAARRFGGTAAAWVAGLAVAFSTSLTHLDGHVEVSGLAAFLVAGACWSCAPTGDEAGRGPLAAGVWLGLGALARPVVLAAVPFVVALFVLRRPQDRVRAAALVLAPLLACAGVSFARNVAVSGEPVVFTTSAGQNLHLGNNPAARRAGQMATDEFRFAPRGMQEDGRFRVGFELGREPSDREVSSWYSARAAAEYVRRPGESLDFAARKTRWFFAPGEPASTAHLGHDLHFAPLLALAFVPTWALAALALAAVFVAARRRDLLLGPGSLVLAHVAACVATFPVEHFRTPAVPAMAVLAGCTVAAAWEGARRGAWLPLVVATVVASSVALVGALPPSPPDQTLRRLVNECVVASDARDFAAAERSARAALAIDPESFDAIEAMSFVLRAQGRAAAARPWAERAAARRPWHPLYAKIVAWIDAYEGRPGPAKAEMDRLVALFPWSAQVRAWRGELRTFTGDRDGARDDFRAALADGAVVEEWALRACEVR
jgi:4-amino-4-deoxy-L-arabinose transferase-like glycosyltransferase